MSRYSKYSKLSDDKLHYLIPEYPEINMNPVNLLQITTKAQDRLDLLAAKYFNNSKYWWLLALINNLPGDSVFVQAGIKLYIPKDYYRYVF